tara:strand:- start:2044 stop:2232 length:189 start_codon:yes stop_codon:yes gene_type:complete
MSNGKPMVITEDNRVFLIKQVTDFTSPFQIELIEVLENEDVHLGDYVTEYCAVEEIYNNILK